MGKEEQSTQNENAATTENPTSEEPPKLEEIVTDEVIQQVINGYNPDLELVSWKAQVGTKVGDNYMSSMFAMEMDLKDKKKGEEAPTEKVHVMLKTMPRNVVRADMINDMNAFGKEALVYKDVLPILIKTQEEKGISKEEIFRGWPKCYAAYIDGQTDFLAMENLKVLGYTMGDRKNGLDFSHCSSVLRSLAKYHAISYAKYGGSQNKILEEFPTLVDRLFGMDSKTSELQQQFFSQSFKLLADTLRNMGEDVAANRMDKLADAATCSILSNLVSNNVNCAVLAHGDCWLNNMLFQYSDQDGNKSSTSGPLDVMFIDFQLCLATSRLVDFYYFFLTSTQFDVLAEREEDLLMIYYSEFTSYAEKLGVNTAERGLTWESLQKEANEFRFYGVAMALHLVPIFAAESDDIPDMDTYTQDDLEDTETAINAFYKDLTKGNAMPKVKHILLHQLPKCSNSAEYL